MANLIETATYDAAVPQLETNTKAIGGPGGVMNAQAQALANRTKFLKDHLDTAETKLAGIEAGADVTANHEPKAHQASHRIGGSDALPAAAEGTPGLVGLATTVPAALGTASKGSATTVAKADHVHAMPTLDDIGEGTTYKRVTAAEKTALAGATSTPTANAIPKADSSGKLDSWVSDASTSVKGKVQLAQTGVEDATKVPKATGAELAALLDAGGYNLDSLADGTTYKRILTEKADKINTDLTVDLIPDATTDVKGKVKLAQIGGTTSETVVQANDPRLTTYGTWTPVLGGDSESGQTYISQAGWYVKNNKFAVLTYRIKLSAKGTITGTLAKIKGLPFTGPGGGGGYSLDCGGHIGLYVFSANFAYGSKNGTDDFRVTDITDSSELHGSIILTL